MIDSEFWKGKKVFLTGHTGFKGSWLSLWLTMMGAEVTGFALEPPTKPSLFELCNIEKKVNSVIGDIRDYNKLHKTINDYKPEIVIHMAAQPIVRESYINPAETYEINVMGTVNLLETIRKSKGIKAVVNVTTDKCYENKEWLWGYRENEPLGGYDPYSNSKACSELVTSSYRNSFFNSDTYKDHGVALATARAGNVIGGGDWAKDRLIPDCIRSILDGSPIIIRNPNSIRPWQHVLEPLGGYLLLARKLYEYGSEYASAWNFGPDDKDCKTVGYIVSKMCELWGEGAKFNLDNGSNPHEANFLKLDCSKSKYKLGWEPKWSLDTALEKIVDWTKAYKSKKDLEAVCYAQIKEYMN